MLYVRTVLCRFLVTYWRTLPMVTFPQCSSSICVDMCTICVNSAFFQMRLIDSWKLLQKLSTTNNCVLKDQRLQRTPPPWQREGRHFKATRIQKTTKACCIILFSTSGFDFIYFIFFRTHCSLQMLSGSLLFFFFFFFLSGGCQHIVMTAPVSIHHSGCFENEAALSQCSFWS